MRSPAVRPRLDQVAELTLGVQLPLAPIAHEHLQILAEGLQQAFNDIRVHAPTTVTRGDEPEVTALMQARLIRMIREDPLWQHLVVWVGRGEESISFDGSHLEKRPDLSIILSATDRPFPLIAEAKILDTSARKTIALYCEKGIRRFVVGEYAWGNREAFMIGYVRDGSSIKPTLTAGLSSAADLHPGHYLVESLPVPVGPDSIDLACTRHGRDFVYIGQQPPNEPGSISIWHLWLR